jgi:hypothetical protein
MHTYIHTYILYTHMLRPGQRCAASGVGPRRELQLGSAPSLSRLCVCVCVCVCVCGVCVCVCVCVCALHALLAASVLY